MTTNNSLYSTVYLRGKAYYAKVLGPPVLNYAKDGKEWTIEISLTDGGVKQLTALGLKDRIKNKGNELGNYISLKQKELRFDGTPAEPIEIVDINDRPWDQSKKIGNKSDVDVRLTIKKATPGKKEGVYLKKMRVLSLVPYESNDFPPITEDDEFFGKALPVEDFGDNAAVEEYDDLDDDLA